MSEKSLDPNPWNAAPGELYGDDERFRDEPDGDEMNQPNVGRLEIRLDGTVCRCIEEIPNGLRWVNVLTREQLEAAIVRSALDSSRAEGEPLQGEHMESMEEIAKLANFLSEYLPHEISRSENAVDIAIRLLRRAGEQAAPGRKLIERALRDETVRQLQDSMDDSKSLSQIHWEIEQIVERAILSARREGMESAFEIIAKTSGLCEYLSAIRARLAALDGAGQK